MLLLTIINKLKVIEQLENGVLGKKLLKNLVLANRLSDIKKQKESIKTFDVGSDKGSVSNRQTLKNQKKCCWKKLY
jgi:hypothetical protein